MTAPQDVVHLHVHSHYSLLDGAGKIEDLVARAAELGMPALALTDHGNMHGIVQFQQAAQKAGIKPILGFEAYVAPGSRTVRKARNQAEACLHLVLLAENNAGYQNLLKLATVGYVDGFYYKPRIDKEFLAEHSEGLIGLSGCLGGEIPQRLLAGDFDGAVRAGQDYVDILGRDNFFVELQNNGLEDQVRLLEPLCRVADALGIGTVATSDVHYVQPEDARAQDVLLCITTNKTLDDQKRMSFEGEQYYLRAPDEMRKIFADFPDALANTVRIADRCNAVIDTGTFHYPIFEPPGGRTAEQYLRELSEAGFAEKYPGNPPEPRERLEYELQVIHDKGFDTYFLIVWDFLRFAREQGIPAGTRGSGCSSIVGYCIGISTVDPIRYNLMFERFLDPEREEMPDYDIDLCERRRGEVIDYVRQKYGAENVAQIGTFGTLKARGAIRDVARVMGIDLATTNAIAKKIPNGPKDTLGEAIEKDADVQQLRDQNPDLFEIALRVEGLNRSLSTHPAGVVIADKPLDEYVPLCKQGEGEVTTQWPMNDIATVGLLKMDFLGLRTLTIVQDAVDLVRETTGDELDLDRIPLDDAKTFELFQRGDTNGVFQFGSSGIRAMLVKIKPERVEHLIAANALYRPGPLNGGEVDRYIECRHDPSKVEYEHPILEECLAESYGIMATQEQVMMIVHKFAGFTMGKALKLVKAISKKKESYIEDSRAKFYAGSVENGIPKDLAERVFNLIVFFGGYGFNRAHSTAYAILAYKTAYLKAHYPVEFMAATLTGESGTIDDIVNFVGECRRMGVEVLGPSVNASRTQFTVEDGKVRYGLCAIRGVGGRAADAIGEARDGHGPFTSLFDFCETVDLTAVNRQTLETLIKCGAFDWADASREQMLAALDGAMRAGADVQRDRRNGQKSLFGAAAATTGPPVEPSLPVVAPWPSAQRLEYERETLGFYLTGHPLDEHRELLREFDTHTAAQIEGAEDGDPVLIGGLVREFDTRITQSGRSAGKRMARFVLEDLTGSVACTVFGETYEREARPQADGECVFVRGNVSRRGSRPSITVTDALPFQRMRSRFTDIVYLLVQDDRADDAVLKRLLALLQRYQGRTTVIVEIQEGDEVTAVQASSSLKVQVSDALVAELERLLGPGSVRLGAHKDRALTEETRWRRDRSRRGRGEAAGG
jgi:DNA polymerase-3 subunit alpha